jgi:SAM-dependent methyltransferase
MLRGMSLETWKTERSAAWGSAPFDRVVHQLAPVHEHLVASLVPRAGERWLDVATGTGAVALRAARAGARVTGLDFAPELLETATRLAAADGLEISFDRGDAERLPYEDESFDVVSSSVGLIFAPQHAPPLRSSPECCRRAGALESPRGARTRAGPSWPSSVLRRRTRPAIRTTGVARSTPRRFWEMPSSFDSRRANARSSASRRRGVWELVSSSVGPMKTLVATLDDERRETLRQAELEHLREFDDGNGVHRPQAYLLVLGERR